MSKRKIIIVTIAGISTGVIIGVPIIQQSFQLVERYQIHPVVALLGYTAVGVLLWHLADILEEMAYRPRLSKTKLKASTNNPATVIPLAHNKESFMNASEKPSILVQKSKYASQATRIRRTASALKAKLINRVMALLSILYLRLRNLLRII